MSPNMSKAHVYTDINVIHPRGYWDYESLAVQWELMLLGFISLLLTAGKGTISEICISKGIGNSWLPCDRKFEEAAERDYDDNEHKRRLLSFHRSLAAAAYEDKCAAKGKVPFLSEDGMHQLHIFISALAVFHLLYCIITLALGRAKMHKWKAWELETKMEYQCAQDPERFRFTRDTTFGRRHLNFWCRPPILIWMVIEMEGKNVKALYRKAQTYINLADLDLAEINIKKALELDPANRDVKLEYKVLKEKMKEFNKKDAKFYGNMFAN